MGCHPGRTAAMGHRRLGRTAVGRDQPPAAPRTFVQRNVNSLLVAGLVVVCVLIAATTGYIVFAFIPAFVAARAVQEKEPLAWPAVGIAVALVIWRFLA